MNLDQKTSLEGDLKALLNIEQSLVRVENNLEHVNNHVKQIDRNLQAVELRIEKTNGILGINTESLIQHMRRTALLESSLKEERETRRKDMADDRQRFFQLMATLVMAVIGGILSLLLKS